MQEVLDVRPPDLKTARAVGEAAGQLALQRAEREAPDFAKRAETAILAKLAAGPASGEDLTEHVRAVVGFDGDGRCMGPIYKKLRKDGAIRVVGDCYRVHGNGTRGGNVYALGDQQ